MLKRSVLIYIGLLALPGLASAAGSVQLPATNQDKCFDVNGSERVCAGTGEDGEKQAGTAWPTPRFDVRNDGTVRDKLTGLTWSKHANAPNRALPGSAINNCPNAESDMLWPEALDFIACLNAKNHAGFSDWRLPNINELESLFNAGETDTAAWLNASGFGFAGIPLSLVQSSGQYWTSTSDASAVALPDLSAAAAWEMDLVKGDFPFSILKNGATNRVWPVRGQSGIDQLWRTGQAACYNDLGDARPCTGTGEDGSKLAGAAWPVPRFKSNAGATFALDRLTGLIWTTATMSPGPAVNVSGCNAGTNLTWQEALDHVACLNTNNFLGRSDWRLPNRKELRSLADYSTGGPALPAGHPFDDPDGLTYWSSTTNASATTAAWAVSMLDGSLSGADKAATLPAWPVSGPDLALPGLTINQGNMTTKTASQTISGTVDAGAKVTVARNGGAPAAAVVTGTTWSATIDPLTTGANNITVTATNFSENSTSASIIVTLDTAAPALSLNPVTALTKVSSQTVSGTVEAGATVTVQLGATVIPVTVTGTAWSADVQNLVEGANIITVTAVDGVGNTSALPPVTITLDTVPPVTTATTATGHYFDSVAVALAASEAGSTIYYTTDGSAVTTASPVYSAPVILAATATTSFTVRFMAVDQAGNAEAAKNAAYTIQLGCDLNGDSKVEVSDALKALQIALGLSTPTPEEKTRGDVAPLVNGKPAPDGIIDIRDTLVILQRSVGLLSPW